MVKARCHEAYRPKATRAVNRKIYMMHLRNGIKAPYRSSRCTMELLPQKGAEYSAASLRQLNRDRTIFPNTMGVLKTLYLGADK